MAIAQVRSGDVAGLQAANPALQFVVPEAGSTLFARDMVVPRHESQPGGRRVVDELDLRPGQLRRR